MTGSAEALWLKKKRAGETIMIRATREGCTKQVEHVKLVHKEVRKRAR